MIAWLREHVSLTGWASVMRLWCGEFWLIRADADWMRDDDHGYFSVTVGLLGLTACLTYWPHGKDGA